MPMFVHRCPDCGHNHLEHAPQQYKGSACSTGACPCGRVLSEIHSPPELIPTFVGFPAQESDTLIEPGAKIGAPHFRVFACDCAACHEAYARIGGA